MTLNLEAIKARCEKATAGPWYGYEERESSAEGHAVSTGPSNLFTIGISNQDANDADFIAHARTDIPALVAEVERLQSALAAARAALDGERDACDEARSLIVRGAFTMASIPHSSALADWMSAHDARRAAEAKERQAMDAYYSDPSSRVRVPADGTEYFRKQAAEAKASRGGEGKP